MPFAMGWRISSETGLVFIHSTLGCHSRTQIVIAIRDSQLFTDVLFHLEHSCGMARQARVVILGLPHHITHWGNNRQDVFFVDGDRVAYLGLLREQCEKQGVRVLGYCLMPNHIHLVATPAREDSEPVRKSSPTVAPTSSSAGIPAKTRRGCRRGRRRYGFIRVPLDGVFADAHAVLKEPGLEQSKPAERHSTARQPVHIRFLRARHGAT